MKVVLNSSATSTNAFLETDRFFVELKFPPQADALLVEEAFVRHGFNKPDDAPLIRDLINDSDWDALLRQLNGLARFHPRDVEE